MSSGAEEAPQLLAYVSRLTARPGESLELMVSSLADSYQAEIVRLVHGAKHGPGRKFERIASLGAHHGEVQAIRPGSYLTVAADGCLQPQAQTASAWIYPTGESWSPRQAIISHTDSAQGWSVGLADGHLALWLGSDPDPALRTDRPIHRGEWSFVAASFDADGTVTLVQEPARAWPVDTRSASARATLPGWRSDGGGLLIAAAAGANGFPCSHFNGRIDRPSLSNGALPEFRAGSLADAVAELALVAAWDAGAAVSDTQIPDIGPHGMHAQAVNFPARGIPGHNWSGREVDFKQAPDEFGALHFHDDDLTDAGWTPSLTYLVPDDLRSGVYAFRLQTDTSELLVSFFVSPVRGTVTAPLAVLIPTMTYLAYANVHAGERSGERLQSDEMTPEHRWAAKTGVRSLYDVHSDGSGTYYASHRRPLTTITPDHIDPHTSTLWNLSADLCLVDWLEHEGLVYDVITDHALHQEGVGLLSRYRTVVSGTHPEYYTEPMLDAHEQYVSSGGRYMYLGGNGYYWVTGVSNDDRSVVEIRRGHAGERTWEAAAGECYLSTTGEIGGLWRHRGRAPQRHLGVGFTSQGTSASGRPYTVKKAAAQDPRSAFILDRIGDVVDGCGLIAGHPAGSEIDRADRSLGTPPHAIVVGTARGFGPQFTLAVEDVKGSSTILGPEDPLVRSDLVFFETGSGGAVFSAGSIAWCTALADDDYESDVARLTGNVLRRFLDPAPFSQPDR